MIKHNTIYRTLKLFLVMFLLVGYTNQGNDESFDIIKIGFVGPLAGDAALYGIMEKNVLELAVEEINEDELISGKTLEIIYEDGKSA